jgi:pimeloyl-ACP methyl ester carboxylesterase
MVTTTPGSRLRVGDLSVHVWRSAARTGPAVVVLHGWGASIEAVRSITGALRDSADVVAIDLPGFGASDPPPTGWDVDDYARLVRDVLAQLGIERYGIVAHSFGARISIVLAAARDAGVERMVLTGAAGLKPRRKPSYYAKVALAKAGKAIGRLGPPGRRLQARIRGRVASSDWLEMPEGLRDTFRLVIAQDLGPRLPRIDVPTLLIWGEADADTPLWMGQRMEAEIPDAALVVLPGAGHYAYAERAQEFNKIARVFLIDQAASRRTA